VWTIAVCTLGVGAYLVGAAVGLMKGDPTVLQALVIAPVLIALTLPIARRIAHAAGDPSYTGIIIAAAVTKLAASLVRYLVAFVVYSKADATAYVDYGSRLVASYRHFDFSGGLGRKLIGTGFARALTGGVFAFTGRFRVGGFFVFAWLGFLGLLCFLRAFQIAVPNGDARRYAVLVLFLPSLLYWPSAIGKEAWMMLGLGLASYGVALLLTRPPRGALMLALGLFGVGLVRPHLGLVVFAGLAAAVFVRRASRMSPLVPVLRVGAILVVALIGIVLTNQAKSFFGVKSLTQEADTTISSAGAHTEEGGSKFTPVRVRTPIDVPAATVTVFFRPFPFEAHNTQTLTTAGESLILLGLVALSWPRLRGIPRSLRETPYIAYCLGYLAAFVYAFSSFGNFGILARQRVQAFPVLLVLLALPRVPHRVPAGMRTH
jgi:hypothetical protein